MRAVPAAFAVVTLCAFAARAEDMVSINTDGLMCRNEKALADFTAPDGSVKRSTMAVPFSAASRRFMAECQGAVGVTVHVITRRNNTSIVTYNGGTWYVPNIDFMTPRPDCIKDGAQVTMAGTIESGFARTDEADPKKGYHYPRLMLDTPVCYLGNVAEKAGRTVSLTASSAGAFNTLMGRHVTVSGKVESPDNGNQPPDAMMMFDPVVRPLP